jgi:hypothetical protein
MQSNSVPFKHSPIILRLKWLGLLGLLLLNFILPASAAYTFGDDRPSSHQRILHISNHSALHFDLSMYLFPNTQIANPVSSIAPTQNATLTLQNDYAPFANATVWFKLDNHTVFSVIMVDKLVSLHGCKSKNTLFHKSNYICQLDETPVGLQLKILPAS